MCNGILLSLSFFSACIKGAAKRGWILGRIMTPGENNEQHTLGTHLTELVRLTLSTI